MISPGRGVPTFLYSLELQVISEHKSSSVCCFDHVRQTGFFLDILPMIAEIMKLLAKLTFEWLPHQLKSNLQVGQRGSLSTAKNGLGIRAKHNDVHIGHRESMGEAFMVGEQFLINVKLRQHVAYPRKHVYKLLKVFFEFTCNLNPI